MGIKELTDIDADKLKAALLRGKGSKEFQEAQGIVADGIVMPFITDALSQALLGAKPYASGRNESYFRNYRR